MKWGPTLIGAVVGYYTSIFLIAAINGFAHLMDSEAADEGYYDVIGPTWTIILTVLGVGAEALAGWFFREIFAYCVQTFIAAYLIVRGTTFWYNAGFPSELDMLLSATVQLNGIFHIPLAFYFYLILILIMWFLGFREAIRQLRKSKNQNDAE